MPIESASLELFKTLEGGIPEPTRMFATLCFGLDKLYGKKEYEIYFPLLACRTDLNTPNETLNYDPDSITLSPGKNGVPVFASPNTFFKNLWTVKRCVDMANTQSKDTALDRKVIMKRLGGFDITDRDHQALIARMIEDTKAVYSNYKDSFDPEVALVTTIAGLKNTRGKNLRVADYVEIVNGALAGFRFGGSKVKNFLRSARPNSNNVRGVLTHDGTCIVIDKTSEPNSYTFENTQFDGSNCPGCPLLEKGCFLGNLFRYPKYKNTGELDEGNWRKIWPNVSEHVASPIKSVSRLKSFMIFLSQGDIS